ncbi:Actin- protein 6 [Dinochytrium kinnereticum]|nr:Actin- protein 6 [Dinochytrium kinnereticum]
MFNFPHLQELSDEIIFEDYGFLGCCRTTDQAHKYVVSRAIFATKTFAWVDIGGKLLTNHLKETISFRQWNMMEETFIVNDIKEACCYITPDTESELENARLGKIDVDYILPDFRKRKRGSILTSEVMDAENDQTLRMGIERFMVPELLFRPTDIGIPQGGISEAVYSSLTSFSDDMRGLFYSNIVVCGGNFSLPGAIERLTSELRKTASTETDVKILAPASPTRFVWDCGSEWASVRKDDFCRKVVTKADYEENGPATSQSDLRR